MLSLARLPISRPPIFDPPRSSKFSLFKHQGLKLSILLNYQALLLTDKAVYSTIIQNIEPLHHFKILNQGTGREILCKK